MQLLRCSSVFLLLYIFPLFPRLHSLQCDAETEYRWPAGKQDMCCLKCSPGQQMKKRCKPDGQITACEKCREGFYADSHNVDLECKQCADCGMSHLVYVRNCTLTQNSVCSCAPGYRCKSMPCLACEPVALKTPHTPITTAHLDVHPKMQEENVSVLPVGVREDGKSSDPMIPLLWQCVCMCILLICLALISRCKNVLHLDWWRNHGLWAARKTTPVISSAEEDVQTPIQEVCEKPDMYNTYC